LRCEPGNEDRVHAMAITPGKLVAAQGCSLR
jgi:hypothetical protein